MAAGAGGAAGAVLHGAIRVGTGDRAARVAAHPPLEYLEPIYELKLSLDALCSRYGIDRSHRVKHGALLDAELLAQVYVELKGGRQIGFELAAEAAVVEITTTPDRPAVRMAPTGPSREPRPHQPSAAELARHREFMAGIENPLWG